LWARKPLSQSDAAKEFRQGLAQSKMEKNDDAADCVCSIRIGTGVVSKVKWKKYILSKSGKKDADAEKRPTKANAMMYDTNPR
jgi:hypothetical protein